ncbi:hypothetical protein HHI36_020825 [Cryptolaemus montrouzieri]|uniref:Uncharacterized protein n=1 Tax=Cryptolaemus montrouzieri TaxID=559131 RepID=A0ABD2NBE5_9CUCU
MNSNDDKIVVHQFMGAEKEATLETNEGIFSDHARNTIEIDFSKVKKEQPEKCLEIGNLNEIIYGNVEDTELEDSKTFLDGFVEDNKKIWDRNSFLE